MSAEHDLAKAIADAVDAKVASTRPQSSTMPATYQGTDSEGKGWVLLPGATEPTPVSRMAVEAAQGDTVSVTVANGKATVDSNVSNPSAGLAGVKVVERTANTASATASNALVAASDARTAATSAQASADTARQAANEATADASTAHAMAESATADAATASESAAIAKTSADKATFALSDVENVVGTLNWIAEHGEYVLTSDTAIVDGKAYYTRSGTAPDYVYTVVASPVVSELSTYYELQLDESVQNYLASHLWLDDYGLNLSVDSANGYRVHQGTVDGTHAAGAYIIDPQGAIVASFGAGGFQVGLDDESHMVGDYHSLQLIDKEGDTYFHVSDLRGADGTVEITAHFDSDGSRTYNLNPSAANTEYTVTVSDGSGGTVTNKTIRGFQFSESPTDGAVITVVYRTADPDAKAYTLGYRMPNRDVGPLSYAEGGNVTASGLCSHAEGALTTASGMSSHAEGRDTVASGQCSHAEGTGTTAGYGGHAEGRNTTADFLSHAEGRDTTADMHSHAEGWGTKALGTSHAEGKDTEAKGSYSHAQNLGTKALSQAQTALGKYNVEDANGDYALIVGNGTSDSARSNALTVDWDGKVEFSGGEMSGSLYAEDGAYYNKRVASIDTTTTPSSQKADNPFQVLDANGIFIGQLRSVHDTNGNIGFRLIARQGTTASGGIKQASLGVGISPAGAVSYTVSSPTAFRNAIELSDTPVTTTTVSSIATAGTNITITSASYASWGRVAMVVVVFKPTASITANSVVAKIVQGKRPALAASGNDSNSTYPCTFDTTGNVLCRRALTSGTSYTYRCMYILA